ncbi:MAG: 3-hydroxyacyl-CoA dehydrogenase NAD-binding domain-containing protein [Verrucomicrobiota bacterium]|nr:3-hydroxyacyl-CoA dehydrogenase NAD-binding domain-containing protein [Verrucomicrobiota bacterium]
MIAMIAPGTNSMIKREVAADGICLLSFDRPESGANIFDAATMNSLREHLDAIEKDHAIKGVIVTSAKKSIFIAGADLQTLLRQAQTGELRAFIADGQKVFNRLAALKVPTVAAIHGACAGGGYEITLACDYRIATNDPATKIGLPETTLGLVPAWGGATRLPRLIGVDAAADVITKGKLHSAADAFKLGLVDDVVPREQLLEAARKKIAEGKRKAAQPPASSKELKLRQDHNNAPQRALDIITAGKSIDESLGMEIDAIVELGKTATTQNLIRNFFLGDKFKKGLSKSPNEKITHAAVIGAGVMGSGIAQWLSARGVTVILRDVQQELLDRGLSKIEKTYGDAVKRGLMSEEKAQEGRARIVASTNITEMRDVGIVIEAASEKVEIKQQIFAALAANTPAKAILATNTSALSISDLGETTGQPARIVGLHFFNPVSRMKLIEVVVGKKTAAETVERALGFARQIGKLPVQVQDSPGFLVNRVLFPYLLDAAELFQSDVPAKAIDDALLEWGMPMGPLRLIDEIGVDITVDIANTLEKTYGERDRAPEILRRMLAAKMLGRKSGGGFYKYEGKQQTENEALAEWRQKSGEHFATENLAARLVFLMINEAARCLEEGVVRTPEDADFGMMMGTGFAPFRGGPLRYADNVGLKKIVTDADGLHAIAGDKFAACDLLRQHAQNETTFYGRD